VTYASNHAHVIAAAALLLACVVALTGCGKSGASAADPEPFKKAIAQYLESRNMAMALKEIKEGPTVEDRSATLTASLTHATLGGPAVTWRFRFEKNPDGSWKAIEHK